jgi:hypothetical protein
MELRILQSPLHTKQDMEYEWGHFTCNIDTYGECKNIKRMMEQMMSALSPLFDHVFDSSFSQELTKHLYAKKIKGLKYVTIGTHVDQSATHFPPLIMDYYKIQGREEYFVSTAKHKLYTVRCEPATDEEHTFYFEMNIPVTMYFESATEKMYAFTTPIRVIRIGVRTPNNVDYEDHTNTGIQLHIPLLKMKIPSFNILNVGLLSDGNPIAGVFFVFAYIENRPQMAALNQLKRMMNGDIAPDDMYSSMKKNMDSFDANTKIHYVMTLIMQSVVLSGRSYENTFISPSSIHEWVQ